MDIPFPTVPTRHPPPILAAAGQLRSKFFESLHPDMLLITSIFEFSSPCYTSALDWDILSGVPTAAIAYDLIPLLFPDKYLPQGHLRTERYLEKVAQLKHFDLPLAISDGTRRHPHRACGNRSGQD